MPTLHQEKKKERERPDILQHPRNFVLGSLSDSLFPEKDTKEPIRPKVGYFFSQLLSFLLKTSLALPIPSSSPHPHPTTKPLPPQSLSSPTDTPFLLCSTLLLSQLPAQGSCPGSSILAEIPPSLSSLYRAGMAKRGHLGRRQATVTGVVA